MPTDLKLTLNIYPFFGNIYSKTTYMLFEMEDLSDTTNSSSFSEILVLK
jgi:hypothetical protein